MTPDPIRAALDRQPVLILDGGLATELEARGHDLGDDLWSARLLADDPDAIRRVHLDYLTAGADVVVSASYQASLNSFLRKGWGREDAVSLIRSAVRIAGEARDAFWSGAEADPAGGPSRLRPLVAASVGPYGAVLADGSEYTGAYDLDETGLREFHRERLGILATAGADLLACETIPSGVEARVLAGLLSELSADAPPAWMTFSCRDGARLADGTDVAELIRELEPVPNLVAVGVNCTAPEHLPELIDRTAAVTSKPIAVYPNSGERWDAGARCWAPGVETLDWPAAARDWVRRGARLVGGCCRVGPSTISALRDALLASDERALIP